MTELPETHPQYVYCTVQGGGIVREGRPIRGNFYCFKLRRKHSDEIRNLFDNAGSTSEKTLQFLDKHKIDWSQHVDSDGYER